MYLETKYAHELIMALEDAQDVGFNHIVFPTEPVNQNLMPQHLRFFDTMGEAMQYLGSAAKYYLPKGPGQDYTIQHMKVDQLIEQIKQDNPLTKQKDMNYNNLENLKEELKKLGFNDKVTDEMQKKMEKGLPEFILQDKMNGSKGQVDLTLHFKQSGQSENYFFNKFDVALNNGKPLDEGHKYFVISPNPNEPGKNLTRNFENVTEAIGYFKQQQGDSKLVSGKDLKTTTELARMEKGNINYVAKDFGYTFRTPAKTQTFFVDRGKGFTAEQAGNMIQGRAVYRDDLVSAVGQYKAWVKLDMDNVKDKYQNYSTLQYHVPTYGFDLEKVLDKFQIKELNDPAKKEALTHSLENGNRPLVTLVKDGKDTQLHMEAVPRYSQLNFFREDGKPEKREQFLKEPKLDNTLQIGKGKGQAKAQEQGMSV